VSEPYAIQRPFGEIRARGIRGHGPAIDFGVAFPARGRRYRALPDEPGREGHHGIAAPQLPSSAIEAEHPELVRPVGLCFQNFHHDLRRRSSLVQDLPDPVVDTPTRGNDDPTSGSPGILLRQVVSRPPGHRGVFVIQRTNAPATNPPITSGSLRRPDRLLPLSHGLLHWMIQLGLPPRLTAPSGTTGAEAKAVVLVISRLELVTPNYGVRSPTTNGDLKLRIRKNVNPDVGQRTALIRGDEARNRIGW
jgi:hypothetical protein